MIVKLRIIQINIDDEPTKSGINILDLDDFIMKIDKLKNEFVILLIFL